MIEYWHTLSAAGRLCGLWMIVNLIAAVVTKQFLFKDDVSTRNQTATLYYSKAALWGVAMLIVELVYV